MLGLELGSTGMTMKWEGVWIFQVQGGRAPSGPGYSRKLAEGGSSSAASIDLSTASEPSECKLKRR